MSRQKHLFTALTAVRSRVKTLYRGDVDVLASSFPLLGLRGSRPRRESPRLLVQVDQEGQQVGEEWSRFEVTARRCVLMMMWSAVESQRWLEVRSPHPASFPAVCLSLALIV